MAKEKVGWRRCTRTNIALNPFRGFEGGYDLYEKSYVEADTCMIVCKVI